MSIPLSRYTRRVFVDTAAYFALVDEDSRDYAAATTTVSRLTTEDRRLFTTNFVVAETHALILNRLGRDLAARAVRRIDESTTAVVRIEIADEQRAREIIFAHTDKDYSLTDAMSFAVMERLGIDTAFTFDRHFAQFGFRVIGPE